MTEGTEVFHANITATDDVTKVANQIMQGLQKLAGKMHDVEHAGAKIHNPRVWELMKEHTHEAGENFDKLGEHVKSAGESITDLVPALGALSGGASLAALAETAEKTADRFGELKHAGEALGLTAQQMNVWNNLAKLTDTNVDSLDHSMGRLNRTLSDAAHGRSKDAASLFAHLHLDPKQFNSAADALPALADAFERTVKPTDRAAMAQKLFGRAGMDMIPILDMGGNRVRSLMGLAEQLGHNFSRDGEALEHYNFAMKKLSIATQGFADEVGADLAPVLEPVIDDMTKWVVANRAWIATGITGEVKQLAIWAQQLPFDEVGSDLKTAAGYAGDFIDKIGGARVVIDGLAVAMGLKGVFWLGAEIAATAEFTLGVGKAALSLAGLVTKFGEVAAAADVAAVSERAALAAGGVSVGAGALATGGAVVAGAAATAGIAAGLAVGLKHATDAIDRATGLDAYASAHAGANSRGGRTSGRDPRDDGPRRVYGGLPSAFTAGEEVRQIGGGSFAGHAEERRAFSHLDMISPLRIQPIAGLSMNSGPQEVRLVGKAEVDVRLSGAPAGTTATATATGMLDTPHVNTGQAWGDHYGSR